MKHNTINMELVNEWINNAEEYKLRAFIKKILT